MKKKWHYWALSAIKGTLIPLIMCTAYGLVMFIGEDEVSITTIINETIMFYYMIVSVGISAVFCNTTIPLTLDIVLSLGSTRKDAFKHINIFFAIFTLLFTAIFIILGLVTDKGLIEMFPAIITYVACIFLSSGIGAMGGAHNLKKNSKLGFIYFASMLSAVLIPMAILGFSGTVNIMTGGDFSADFENIGKIITCVAIALAILFYGLGMSQIKKQLNIHEVRI